MTAYRILGINDDVTTCECCGKSGLKCTVVLTDGERELAYGRDCAAKAVRPIVRNGKVVGSSLTANRVEQMARDAAAGVKPKQPKTYWSVNEMRAK